MYWLHCQEKWPHFLIQHLNLMVSQALITLKMIIGHKSCNQHLKGEGGRGRFMGVADGAMPPALLSDKCFITTSGGGGICPHTLPTCRLSQHEIALCRKYYSPLFLSFMDLSLWFFGNVVFSKITESSQWILQVNVVRIQVWFRVRVRVTSQGCWLDFLLLVSTDFDYDLQPPII